MPANLENSAVATGLEKVRFHSNPREALPKLVKSLSRVRLFAIPWTVAHQAPPSIEFSRQEYSSGLPFHSPGDLPDPGIKPGYPALQADSLPSELLRARFISNLPPFISLTHPHLCQLSEESLDSMPESLPGLGLKCKYS